MTRSRPLPRRVARWVSPSRLPSSTAIHDKRRSTDRSSTSVTLGSYRYRIAARSRWCLRCRNPSTSPAACWLTASRKARSKRSGAAISLPLAKEHRLPAHKTGRSVYSRGAESLSGRAVALDAASVSSSSGCIWACPRMWTDRAPVVRHSLTSAARYPILLFHHRFRPRGAGLPRRRNWTCDIGEQELTKLTQYAKYQECMLCKSEVF